MTQRGGGLAGVVGCRNVKKWNRASWIKDSKGIPVLNISNPLAGLYAL